VKSNDVIVIGAGVVGLSAARALAGMDRQVVVLERQHVGAEASSAAAGMLSPQGEATAGSALLDLALHARDHHVALAAALETETGIDVELSRRGAIHVALTTEDERELEKTGEWQRARNLPVASLSEVELREAEPNLTPEVRSGLLFAGDYRVDNVRLTRALAASAMARGVTIVSGRPVTELVVESGRVAGARVGGESFRGDIVINAAGAWAGLIPGDPLPPPVEPVRGQMIALDVPVAPVRHVIVSPRGYLVPTMDGRLLVGSTSERVGFDKSVTAAAARDLLAAAIHLVPALADVRIADSWAGLRPGTPDGLPIIGSGGVTGLFHAAGLYRNGILLGPLVGEIVAGLVVGREAPIDLAPFALARFSTRGTERAGESG
jgi:glycine oxidase